MEMEKLKNIVIMNIIFEGEYKNGLKNGKGKEFDEYKSGKPVFEGEYKNGFKNGKR